MLYSVRPISRLLNTGHPLQSTSRIASVTLTRTRPNRFIRPASNLPHLPQAVQSFSTSTINSMPGRYAEAHVSPQGSGDARPTALDIIKDEGLEGKLSDKVVLITGCSSGLGVETARAMSATGAKVYCTARDAAKGQKALEGVLEPGRVELLLLDLNSLESVRTCAKDFLSKSDKLNIIINNAGIMATPTNVKTADGFEGQFGTNHLAHFLLFQLLKPTLLASSTPQMNSRVVCVSSMGHRTSPPNFGDYNYDETEYSAWKAYGQSKTSNIYMANEIDRRYVSRGLHGFSLHPGGIATGLQTHMSKEQTAAFSADEKTRKYMKSIPQGAATSVYAAVSREWEGKGGRYLEDCDEGVPNQPGHMEGYAAHAYNEEGEKRLWADSCKMVGVEDDA